VRCGCHSDKTAPLWVAALGQRRRLAGTTSRSPSTTHTIRSLELLLTQPRPARLHYFPFTLFTHTNAAHGIVAVPAPVSVARSYRPRHRCRWRGVFALGTVLCQTGKMRSSWP
jgi:hypothetical protein